jgi:hypothetical protein
MRPWLALALPLLAAPSQPEIQVSVSEGRVAVRTARAPLTEVLKKLAEATGMEIVYEAARPRQLVSVTIEAATAAQAVERLLEGQGLNYVLRLDPSGKLVQMLFVAGSASPAPASAGADRGRTSARPFRPPVEEPDEPPEDELPAEEETDLGEPFAPPGSTPAETGNPFPGPPMPGVVPGTVPGTEAGAVPGQESSTPEMGPGHTTPEAGTPQPPSPASYPGGAPAPFPVPQPPVPPGPASYP